MQTIVVCAAVIERNGCVLLALRKAGGEQGLLWEFPGGKLIPGESPAQCLLREINEELNMHIEVNAILEVSSHCYNPEQQILLLAYLCRHLNGEGEALDCQDFRWVDPDEIENYNLAPADLPVLEKLLKLKTW